MTLCRLHDLSNVPNHFAAKVAPRYVSPFRILSKEGQNIVIVRRGEGKEKRVHVKYAKIH